LLPLSRSVLVPALLIYALTLACDDQAPTQAGAPKRTHAPAAATSVPVPSLAFPEHREVNEHSWQQLWGSTPGTADRRCVAVEGLEWVRSGDFVVGNFASYRRYWDGTVKNSKLAYTPLHSTIPDQPLTLTADTIGVDPIETVQPLEAVGNAWTLDGIPFFSTGTVLPHRGSWRLVARAGPNWGCFELMLE
jgi:hypothetical protein